ncbi:MAG TPA: glycosyltransferase family 2 protein [Candidatus Polarisedimenticolia bacterium]
MSAPALSVVIPSYQGAERLPRTLGSLVGSQVPGGYEILVIDDGSPDATVETARAFADRLPLSVVRHPGNQGRSAARNTGLRQARAPIALLLDDDMLAEPGLLARHLRAHAGGGRVGAIGRIAEDGLDGRDPFHAYLRREELHRRRRLQAAGNLSFEEVWTGQLSVRREDALAAGLLDETIRSYGLEDIEFAYRLAALGVRFVYLDDAVTRHAGFAGNLERYCARHRGVGEVAAYVLKRHDTPEMRRYLRAERPERRPATLFLRLMDASSALLRRPGVAALLSRPPARWLLRAGIGLLEMLRFDRPLTLLYSLARDIEYFDAMGRAVAADREERR